MKEEPARFTTRGRARVRARARVTKLCYYDKAGARATVSGSSRARDTVM